MDILRSMKKLTENGLAVPEIFLTLFILAILGLTTWFVWHKNQTKTQPAGQSSTVKTVQTAGQLCTTPDKTVQGELFIATDNAYSLCIPDG